MLHVQVAPSQFLIDLLNWIRFSADFISCGKPFQICGQRDLRLFVPKVVWLGQ